MAECVVFGVVAVCEGVGVGVVAGSVWGVGGSDLESLCAFGISMSRVHLECCLGSSWEGVYPGETVDGWSHDFWKCISWSKQVLGRIQRAVEMWV